MSTLALSRISQDRGVGRRRHRVLHDVSLTIAPGEFVLLEGPSGSGKSTLLGVAAGMLTPVEGSVTLAGMALERLSSAAKRRHRARTLGFVFQRPNLVSGLTALDNVRLMAEIAGVASVEAMRRAHDLLERVGLGSLAGRLPHELSGGEEQRLAIARALVHRPALVLADEPTSNLDGHAGRTVAELLVTLTRAHDTAVLVSTYDPRLAPYAQRRIAILDGRLTLPAAISHPSTPDSEECIR